MIHTISNDHLKVSVSCQAAQLQSILSSDGTEYLWQGDSRYWPDRAPNIFPFVARLTGGKYYLDGREYSMRIHGITPYAKFTLAEKTEDTLVMELSSDEESFAQYPRQFVFQVIYRLTGKELSVTYRVENRDEKTMYFGLGGHPGFQVPLAAGKTFEDYRLRFHEEAAPFRVGFTEDCFINGNDLPYPLEDGKYLPLHHGLFDDDAIVLTAMAKAVTLETPEDSHRVTVRYPQMDYLGLWHCPKTDAPYLCIEPWSSLPAQKDVVTVFEDRKDLITLAPGKCYVNTWSMEFE